MEQVRIGFVGTGAITEAVVRGLCTADSPPTQVLLSPRNAERAAKLASEFDRVRIATDNQAVLDGSDLVCLAVRPQVFDSVVPPLAFRRDHHVVSFVPTYSIDMVSGIVAPAAAINRVVPLPPAARHLGPVVLSPPDPVLAEIFGALGKVIEVSDEAQLHALWSVTCLMGAYFGTLDTITGWLEREGVDRDSAAQYAGALYHALGDAALREGGEGYEELVREYMTPQGLNEQALRELKDHGGLDLYSRILDLVLARINGVAEFEDRLE